MSFTDLLRLGLWWGPGILVLVLFGFGFLRLAKYWIERTMDVKRQQIDSLFSMARNYVEQFLSTQKCQADALTRLAGSVEHRDSVEAFEHQEILIALKAVHRDVESLLQRQREAVA